ncbi:sodium/potassium/calcium exchanger [Acrasis kona]|uniref:Sodium/potassium/calcium exchanger n=1 Tax=Acrasis kona TaxID=1008807 RepID=A0AAW2Z8M3_9EUKA
MLRGALPRFKSVIRLRSLQQYPTLRTYSIEEKISQDFKKKNNVPKPGEDQEGIVKKQRRLSKVAFDLNSVPPKVKAFSTVAILPAAICSGLLLFSNIEPDLIMNTQLNYTAIMLAMQGAVHFGLALKNELFINPMSVIKSKEDKSDDVPGRKDIDFSKTLWSILPAFIATTSLSLPPFGASLLLAGGFLVLTLYDITSITIGGAPHWFASYRMPFVIMIVVLLVISFLSYSVSMQDNLLKAKTTAMRRELEEPEQGLKAQDYIDEEMEKRLKNLNIRRNVKFELDKLKPDEIEVEEAIKEVSRDVDTQIEKKLTQPYIPNFEEEMKRMDEEFNANKSK